MLSSILDSKITDSIVRLGSRSTDERIAEYNLGKLEKMGGRNMLDRSIHREYAAIKEIEEDMQKIVQTIQLPRLSWEKLEQFLDIHYPEQAESLRSPPYWISHLIEQLRADEATNGEWTRVEASSSRKQRDENDPELRNGPYGFWKRARDLDFIQPPPPTQSKTPKGKKSKSRKRAHTDEVAAEDSPVDPITDPRLPFFESLGFGGLIPTIPSSRRPTNHLVDVDNVWSMSRDERNRLSASWEEDIRKMAYESNISEFEMLRARYREACKRYNDARDQVCFIPWSFRCSAG